MSGMDTPLDVLTRAVQIATGSDTAVPRAGQDELTEGIFECLEGVGHAAFEGPTGIGKSLAYLSVLGLLAVTKGERSVVSTETIALQRQLSEKDCRTVASALASLGYPVELRTAVLKGWSNYGCVMTAMVLASDHDCSDEDQSSAELVETIRAKASSLAFVDAAASSALEAAAWVIDSVRRGSLADRHEADHIDGAAWWKVSVSSDDCLGDKCPSADICAPRKARLLADEAHIVITNHATLAVQATTGVPVVIGSNRRGAFHHLVIDEAHALPATVREQGASKIDRARISTVIRAINALFASDVADPLSADGEAIGNAVADAIEAWKESLPRRHPNDVRFTSENDPLIDIESVILDWVGVVRSAVRVVVPTNITAQLKLRRLAGLLDRLVSALGSLTNDHPSIARWVDTRSGTVKMSPVQVSGLIRANLFEPQIATDWASEILADPETYAETGTMYIDVRREPDDDIGQAYKLGVVAVSATMPKAHAIDCGLKIAGVEAFSSPFSSAFASSLFYSPLLDSERDRVTPTNDRGGLDPKQHMLWVAPRIIELVEANRGSALVLSATTEGGKFYALQLASALSGSGIRVYSQWDMGTTAAAVDAWREDPSSVLVGTRSLMTGVDAPGDTCSLVIVDRIPRAAGNPVDDARIEDIMARTDLGKWEADRFVYVADAALLLRQALGRLIRTTTDSGVVAIMDPRLPRKGVTISAPARKVYVDVAADFAATKSRTTDRQTVLDFLADRSTS